MPKQQVLDHTGHSTFEVDKADKVSLAEAEKRFKELTGRGFIAIEPGKDGEPGRIVRKFDPEVETTIFQPQLQGG